jgi:hypothetical protein
VAIMVYIHGFDCFRTLKELRIDSGNTQNEMGCDCPRECCISAHTGYQILDSVCL